MASIPSYTPFEPRQFPNPAHKQGTFTGIHAIHGLEPNDVSDGNQQAVPLVAPQREQTASDLPSTPIDYQLVNRIASVFNAAVKYFGGELHGAERIPSTGALIVSNHAFMAIDSTVLCPLIYRETGRLPRGLAERVLYKSPAVSRFLARIGTVKGTRDNAVALLKQGELCLCYPGGADESLKGPGQQYQLLWERAMGYMKVAALAGVPIVPIVGVGVDDAYPSVTRERFFARRILGHSRYDLPVVLGLGPLPLPAKFDFYVGEPFMPPGGADLIDDPERLAEVHHGFWQSTQRFLDEKVEKKRVRTAFQRFRSARTRLH